MIDVSTKPPAGRVYLGDGVYADFDGYQVWIWTSNGIRESERIALEPSVIRNLLDYAKRVGGV